MKKKILLLITFFAVNLIWSQTKTGKEIYETLEASGKSALTIIHSLSKETKLYKEVTLTGDFVSTINSNKLFVIDMIKDDNCNYKFRVLEKDGYLGWISGCENLHFQEIDITNAIKELNNTDVYNENLWTIRELKFIYNPNKKHFLIDNNSLINKETKKIFED